MFDASKIYDTVPLNAMHIVEKRLGSMQNPAAFTLNKKLLQQELYQVEHRCNVAAWGSHASNLPAPTPEEGAELLKRVSSPSFTRDAIEAVSLRYILNGLEVLNRDDRAKHEKAWKQTHDAEAEKEDREAFDAFEASEREQRFQQWRKRR
jgi:hypothetical protein